MGSFARDSAFSRREGINSRAIFFKSFSTPDLDVKSGHGKIQRRFFSSSRLIDFSSRRSATTARSWRSSWSFSYSSRGNITATRCPFSSVTYRSTASIVLPVHHHPLYIKSCFISPVHFRGAEGARPRLSATPDCHLCPWASYCHTAPGTDRCGPGFSRCRSMQGVSGVYTREGSVDG